MCELLSRHWKYGRLDFSQLICIVFEIKMCVTVRLKKKTLVLHGEYVTVLGSVSVYGSRCILRTNVGFVRVNRVESWNSIDFHIADCGAFPMLKLDDVGKTQLTTSLRAFWTSNYPVVPVQQHQSWDVTMIAQHNRTKIFLVYILWSH